MAWIASSPEISFRVISEISCLLINGLEMLILPTVPC
jgi:hypothetical protein